MIGIIFILDGFIIWGGGFYIWNNIFVGFVGGGVYNWGVLMWDIIEIDLIF